MISRYCAPALVAMLAFVMPAVARIAQTDSTFAVAGLLPLPWSASRLEPDIVASAPDGGVFIVREGPSDLTIVRLDAFGIPASSYAGGGITKVVIGEEFRLSALRIEDDGALLLGGGRDVIRVTAAGRLDTGFGQGGRMRIPYVSDSLCVAARIFKILPAADGARIVVASHSENFTGTERGCTFVARIRGDGTSDAGFGTQGNIVRSGLIGFDAAARGEGTIEIAGRYAGRLGNWVERVGADGHMLDSFGTRGSLELAVNGPLLPSVDGRILADGSKVFVAGTAQPTVVLHRYRPDHAFDPGFAGVGRSVIPMRDGTIFNPRVLPAPDGGFIVRGDTSSGGVAISVFYKADAAGVPDRSFGDAGYLRHIAAAQSRVLGWDMQADGFVVFTAVSFASIPPTPPTIPPPPLPFFAVNAHATRIQAVPDIVEFHNGPLNHYFLAYDGVEAQGIDDGAAGPGWSRTLQGFRPGGTTPVCRFYGTPGVGPNSHFFTIDAAECAAVKQDPGWTYEGLGFYATRVDEADACPQRLLPVHRLYNNRAAFKDSNHRYVADLSLIPAMVSQGWVHEGAAFCARP